MGYWFATSHLIGEIKAYNQIHLIVPLTTGQLDHLKLCSVFFLSFSLSLPYSVSVFSGGTVSQGEGSPVNGLLKMGACCLKTFFFSILCIYSFTVYLFIFFFPFSLLSLKIPLNIKKKKEEAVGLVRLSGLASLPILVYFSLSPSCSLYFLDLFPSSP